MLKIGYRIRLRSRKGPDREGVITAVTGSMLRVRWQTEDETTIIPAPGTLTVLAPAPPLVATKSAAKKTAAKKTAAKKPAENTTAAKNTGAKKTAAAKNTGAKKTAAAKNTGAKKTAAKKTAKNAAPTTGGTNTTTRARRSSR